MTRPKLLDLFCCAGGAAMGYHRAGFDVVGIDVNPQPNYPFEFIQADALEYLDRLIAAGPGDLAVVHASPPCQRFSVAANIHDSADAHPDLLASTRERLVALGLPYVIENVMGAKAKMEDPIRLCGSMFDLGVLRHRLFEASLPVSAPSCGSHGTWYASVFGGRCVGRQRVTRSGPGKRTQTWDKFDDERGTASTAMGIDWMTLREMSESIPPAYTEYLGRQLLNHLETCP